MATPATKNDVKNISDKLDKISKSLVDNSTSLLQLTEEIKERFRYLVKLIRNVLYIILCSRCCHLAS